MQACREGFYMSKSADYDGAYRRLFSNPELLEDLVRSFIGEEVAAKLDFGEVDAMETTSRTPDLEKREGDQIWRIRRVDGADFYLFLFLEFQSSNDFTMPVRLFSYTSRFYDVLMKQQGDVESLRFSPMFAVVIYNGVSKWSAKESFEELLDVDESSELWEYQPKLRYRLVDAARALPDKESMTSLIFQLEHASSKEAVGKRLDEFREKLVASGNASLIEDVAIWIEAVLERKPHGHSPTKEQIEHFLEGSTMGTHKLGIDLLFDRLEEEASERGLAKGMEQGLEQGQKSGMRQVLGTLLEQKFGEDKERAARLALLDEDALRAASTLILGAETEDVFWSELDDALK